MAPTVHPTAVVEAGAELGEGVSIGPFCYVQAGAVIGEECRLGAHATVLGGTTVGARCRIHPGAVLGDDPQDFGFKGGATYAEIGSDCILREGVTVHRGTADGSCTRVGKGCMLMANSHVAHNVELGESVVLANGALLGGYVSVGDRAFISGNVQVHQFVKIGRLCMIGGGAGVSKDVPPYFMVSPVEPNQLAGLNTVGLRRAGIPSESRMAIKQAYKILYQSGLNTRDALVELESMESPVAELAEIIGFIKKSERGICYPARD